MTALRAALRHNSQTPQTPLPSAVTAITPVMDASTPNPPAAKHAHLQPETQSEQPPLQETIGIAVLVMSVTLKCINQIVSHVQPFFQDV